MSQRYCYPVTPSRRTSVQLFWTNVNSSLALVAQMLSRSTTPAEPATDGAMAPADTQLAGSLPSTWRRDKRESESGFEGSRTRRFLAGWNAQWGP